MQASTSPSDTIFASAWSRMMVPNGSLSPFLAACKARGWLKARGTQRTDSTHVLAAIRTLHRLERVLETLRAALHQRSAADAAWVHRHVPVAWYERYGPRAEAMRLPKEASTRDALAVQMGAKGYALMDWLGEDERTRCLQWRCCGRCGCNTIIAVQNQAWRLCVGAAPTSGLLQPSTFSRRMIWRHAIAPNATPNGSALRLT
jgi:hypothetical protein